MRENIYGLVIVLQMGFIAVTIILPLSTLYKTGKRINEYENIEEFYEQLRSKLIRDFKILVFMFLAFLTLVIFSSSFY